MVCLSVGGDNPRALASFTMAQLFYTNLNSVGLAPYETIRARTVERQWLEH